MNQETIKLKFKKLKTTQVITQNQSMQTKSILQEKTENSVKKEEERISGPPLDISKNTQALTVTIFQG